MEQKVKDIKNVYLECRQIGNDAFVKMAHDVPPDWAIVVTSVDLENVFTMKKWESIK